MIAPRPRTPALVASLLGVGATIALGCGGEAPPPAAPKPPPLSLAGPALSDAEACEARKAHEKSCSGIDPANAEVLGKVCLGERGCLEELWEKEAVDRYMICRTRATCGADCKLEVARVSPPSRAIKDARDMCLAACTGKDGETLCDAVLQRFTPWKLAEQSIVAACFSGTRDCFGALACAKNGAERPMAQLGTCLAGTVVDACVGKEDVSQAPMCGEVAKMLRRK